MVIFKSIVGEFWKSYNKYKVIIKFKLDRFFDSLSTASISFLPTNFLKLLVTRSKIELNWMDKYSSSFIYINT